MWYTDSDDSTIIRITVSTGGADGEVFDEDGDFSGYWYYNSTGTGGHWVN
jgi:hypothetical protein